MGQTQQSAVFERRATVHPHARGADLVSHKTVHPHARGADFCPGQSARFGSGSSPRTWGRRGKRTSTHSSLRFIPTHVGQTPAPVIRLGAASVHPHARGADARAVSVNARQPGSSPRTWGRRLASASRAHCVSVHPHARGADSHTPRPFIAPLRFIPTHVGQTSAWRRRRCAWAVHPHARGADMFFDSDLRSPRGSSPRTWGRRGGSAGGKRVRRFIPTHVGQTRLWNDASNRFWFIPTHVGQTSGTSTSAGSQAVHPHARGADSDCFALVFVIGGSSPRTWGRLHEQRHRPLRQRFIPTHVGQTPMLSYRRLLRPVHPHARGADARNFELAAQMVGSSPRTWGRRLCAVCRPGIHRFIPTHVGQTASRRAGVRL